MNTNAKRLILTTVLLGIILSVLTATTVMASTNNTPCGQCIRDQDRIQDQDQCCQNEGSCPATCDSLQAQYQHQQGLTCSNGGDGETGMQRARYRYQYRHCDKQEG